MIINNAPSHEAVLSNVGEIGEFRIRNSAKAFSILSSGLYANKIRAIIRELSCNAVDSHVAAGRSDVPFDVHLPNQLDPTFRIRDYGTGLSHDQVLNIYTTYFESTKTESNQFIGALGLGSKSPFSYTDNFTVTAIQDGTRNVYSAFINGEGVPSVALMHSESTTERNGVEIQFAVTDRWDYDKFYSESREVYTHFALRPNIAGGEREFKFREVEYKDRNIIPGVHYTGSRNRSIAVMGNIAYPIDMPNTDTNLGPLAKLLGCGIEMHFDIGELDFQASREGLSYIPQTINAIRAKLEALNAQLAVHLEMEANAITNAWEKVYFLQKKSYEDLWAGAARVYIQNKQIPLMDLQSLQYIRSEPQKIGLKELASRHNISILAFTKSRHSVGCHDVKPNKMHQNNYSGTYEEEWQFPVDTNTIFVKNDLKVGALTRAKYHWRNATNKGIKLPTEGYNHTVYVMSPATKGHAMDTTGFFAALHSPPDSQIIDASSLLEKERKTAGTRAKNVRIVRLEEQSSYYRNRGDIKWKEAGRADQYDSTTTYFYMPLSAYTAVDAKTEPHALYGRLRGCGIGSLNGLEIYGVRKSDIEWVRGQKNWVPVEQHIEKVLNTLTPTVLASLAISEIDSNKIFGYNKDIVQLVRPESPYCKHVDRFKDVQRLHSFHPSHLVKLCETYAPTVDYKVVKDQLKSEIDAVQERYPLLNAVQDWNADPVAIAEYIRLIDNSKGI